MSYELLFSTEDYLFFDVMMMLRIIFNISVASLLMLSNSVDDK